MRMLRDFLARSAIAALFLLSLFVASHAADLTFEKDRIRLLTSGGRAHDLIVELAIDPEQREQGLMHRRQLAADHGMLFDFGETRRVMMWMRNTYLPLDMLFIVADGTVATIHENAVPLSEAIIDSKEPVAFVLELNAGTVKRLGIRPGDRITGARMPAAAR
ncbi:MULTISPECIES: DUF192 domain-containing protein [Sinorhizobium]|uniref:DUF192 domain-containing protein n=1 Tax=Sinorhizobium TaxID=28105 RepID=UPI000BE86D15|nr:MULTISPECIES: DUF192 domain-containing protein [Sinorhizobium]PDT55162.1 hypothetical protein CO664_08970 [Sinorhizobium sp. NG07B]POH32200.1 hypothetical protein ATY30_12535 [Sinorhizobium americanum]